MKIHYFSGEGWEEPYMRAKLDGNEIVFHTETIAGLPDLTDPDADVLCTFIECPITEAEMARFPKVKLIATRSTGFDHIDLPAAAARSITVVNVPSYGENTVAEFTFALLLALSRRIIDADERLRETGGFSPAGLRGFDLSGKTLGVVGTGHIGAHIIRMAQGFEMKVVCFDAFPNEELAHSLGFEYAALPDLLAAADIVTIHLPYNQDTHHLINKDNIHKFKKGAYLLNTSRGAIVETEALVEGLKSGVIAGAGLDVLEEEGILADESAFLSEAHPSGEKLKIALENHYLIQHPRVIVTPHAAFNTIEALERILNTTIENIKNFSAGMPTNTVAEKKS